MIVYTAYFRKDISWGKADKGGNSNTQIQVQAVFIRVFFRASCCNNVDPVFVDNEVAVQVEAWLQGDHFVSGLELREDLLGGFLPKRKVGRMLPVGISKPECAELVPTTSNIVWGHLVWS